MTTILRRLRGLAGLGIFSGVVWAGVGLIIGTAVLMIDPASVDVGEGPFWMAYYFGRAGFVAGVAAGFVVSAVERRRPVTALRLSRVAVWGALGGLALPFVGVAPRPMLPLFVVLGAGTACAALALARRGERSMATVPLPAATRG